MDEEKEEAAASEDVGRRNLKVLLFRKNVKKEPKESVCSHDLQVDGVVPSCRYSLSSIIPIPSFLYSCKHAIDMSLSFKYWLIWYSFSRPRPVLTLSDSRVVG